MMPQSARILTTTYQFFWKTVNIIWQSHSLHLSTKILVYKAVIIPILLYGAETWVLYRKQIRLLEQFHKRCLCSILGIKWQAHVSKEEVLKTASLPSMESILLKVQLRWAGHVTKMEDVRMPKAVFFSQLQEGKRDRGAPRKRYQDQLKRQLAQAESAISHGSRRPRTKTASAHQWEKPFVTSRQRGIKPQRRNAEGKKSEQHPYHPQPKPSSAQSAVGDAHQKSVSTPTIEHTKIDHQPSQQSSSARNDPSSNIKKSHRTCL